MKVSQNGAVIHLEHVTRSIPDSEIQKPRRVFLVQFDGEWDLFFSKQNPSKQEIARCIGELELYYRRDWARTGRTIPILNLSMTEYHCINCI
jgi:hypothetical protein